MGKLAALSLLDANTTLALWTDENVTNSNQILPCKVVTTRLVEPMPYIPRQSQLQEASSLSSEIPFISCACVHMYTHTNFHDCTHMCVHKYNHPHILSVNFSPCICNICLLHNAGLARPPRVEVHPKLQGQPLPNVLEAYMPRLHRNKKLKPDAIQNCENAIADLVSKGAPYAGKLSHQLQSTAL